MGEGRGRGRERESANAVPGAVADASAKRRRSVLRSCLESNWQQIYAIRGVLILSRAAVCFTRDSGEVRGAQNEGYAFKTALTNVWQVRLLS